ncbi:helix-turn-helix domain-containing protein [Paenibacillus sp. ACRSA]|uniref:AraC family transcriptional regulator n=1 Tax=Paenibacillus sp. ACRSA TaxID=2918211 RepID=UPI001EF41C96|nr:helix-turn-helix domain-containing protein [Paenibacillus sp. ACRSA]MCG7377479.1 helix-turn-helix domain-containing protein [Paenibacillus sp. ACRSA]
MDATLHSMFRPIQMNSNDHQSYYMERMPSIELMPYVVCYWESGFFENREDGMLPKQGSGVPTRVLPDGCTDILITYDAAQSKHTLSYCGNYTQPFVFNQPIGLVPLGDYTFGVRFFPGGARSFHGLPLDTFTDLRIALEECWPTQVDELRERLATTNSFDERVQVMESTLKKLSVRIPANELDLMKNVLHRIFSDGGSMNVQELAMREVVSERQLHRKFSDWIGISPKRFSEIVRFHRVLASIHQKSVSDWAALAVEHGFYDQAHLIRHFRKFYGETPLTAAREHQMMMSDLYNRLDKPSVILKQ